MIERITSGEHLLGFNVIGSYVVLRQKKDPDLGLVYPSDYVLVMSRVAFITKNARRPNAAKLSAVRFQQANEQHPGQADRELDHQRRPVASYK